MRRRKASREYIVGATVTEPVPHPARFVRHLALLAALAAFHIARQGYSFGGCPPGILRISPSSDHSNILPWVHHFRDPALYPRDLSIAQGAG